MLFRQTRINRLHRAAENGDAAAQIRLAEMYCEGKTVGRDEGEAAKWWRKAADQGVSQAQYAMGKICQIGAGVPQDDAEAVGWYRRAADQGFLPAYYRLGLVHRDGRGVPQSFTDALNWLSRAVEGGRGAAFHPESSPGAPWALGGMFERGEGVTADPVKAARHYLSAAKLGLAEAQCRIGGMYLSGRGVPQDFTEALKWFTRAAEQGDIEAQFSLGIMYDDGESLEPGYGLAMKKAVEWFEQAAEKGHAQAQNALGIIYAEGRPRDVNGNGPRWSRHPSRRPAEATDDAQGFDNRAGGRVIKPNLRKARQWFELAAKQGDEDALANLAELLKS